MSFNAMDPSVIAATARRAGVVYDLDPLDAMRHRGYRFLSPSGESWHLTEAPNGETFVTRLVGDRLAAFVIDEDFGSLTPEYAGIVVALWRKHFLRAEALGR